MSYANLTGAILSGANLKRAILGETTFKGTVLDGAKFHNASMRVATFISVNLSEAKGLEQVGHLGPSILDFGTIYLSKGDIPEEFLYRAGIPDIFIEYIRSQGKTPFDYYSCFISYASEDEKFVECLYDSLETEGVRCWLAPIDLKPGNRFPQHIEDAIRHHDKLILVLSQYSIQSGWVEHEVNLARERERKGKDILFPIYLDNSYLYASAGWVSYLRDHRHIGNFQRWEYSYHYQTALQRLLDALEKEEM